MSESESIDRQRDSVEPGAASGENTHAYTTGESKPIELPPPSKELQAALQKIAQRWAENDAVAKFKRAGANEVEARRLARCGISWRFAR